MFVVCVCVLYRLAPARPYGEVLGHRINFTVVKFRFLRLLALTDKKALK
jgi:hypothetical protein